MEVNEFAVEDSLRFLKREYEDAKQEADRLAILGAEIWRQTTEVKVRVDLLQKHIEILEKALNQSDQSEL